jgi:hypothetical protein
MNLLSNINIGQSQLPPGPQTSQGNTDKVEDKDEIVAIGRTYWSRSRQGGLRLRGLSCVDRYAVEAKSAW